MVGAVVRAGEGLVAAVLAGVGIVWHLGESCD